MDTYVPQLELAPATEGAEAGRLGVASGANPYPPKTRAATQWECARRSVEAQKLAAALRARARTPQCRYITGECNCGGRGFCLDVA